jgi:hypothetical protein
MLVSALGGSVAAESEFGKGAEFRVMIPRRLSVSAGEPTDSASKIVKPTNRLELTALGSEGKQGQ